MMQNVFPTRELYNSNPCREMWDCEQFSQNLGSSSQGSQNSSTDLFSQSKMSGQLKGFSSMDVWSQPTNSQQMPEDEPIKYYMKYMSKPPLFSSEFERKSSQQNPQSATSYKELIEIQKKKTAERDGRDVLDNFISLLKDYTKEVKAAMDSFKNSIDTTLASKAEQVASAASESADLIKKLKDDLLEGFVCLRKDMKENEELRDIIAKQNKKNVEQDSEIKILNIQLEEYRKREVKASEKQEKFLEREDRLLQKLDEISFRQQTHSEVSIPLNLKSFANQRQEFEPTQYPYQTYGPQNPSTVAFPGQTPFARDSAEVNPSSSIPLHHFQPAPHLTPQNPTAIEALPLNVQVPTCVQATRLSKQLPQQRQDEDTIVPFFNTQKQPLPSAQNYHVVTHPTATIAPMRSGSDQDQRSVRQQEKDITSALVSKDAEETLKQPKDIISARVTKKTKGTSLTSPMTRAACDHSKTAWSEQSPVVTVHPQVPIKKEDDREDTKVLGSPCAKKARKEDPSDFFVFDLTSSPDEESFDAQKIKISAPKTVPEQPVKIHATRSKKVKEQGSKKETNSAKAVDQHTSTQGGQIQGNLTFKVVKGNLSNSNMRGKVASASKSKEKNGTDHKFREHSDTTSDSKSSTPNRPIKANVESGAPRAKVAQHVFQRSKMSFKRNLVAAKRVLSFDASIFDGLEDDENIQQITESIRKHAQKRRAAKVF